MSPLAAPAFTPAPTRRHIAGWTPGRHAAFIAVPADGHTVQVAAASVGLTAQSACRLRGNAGTEDFALARDAALMEAADRLDQTARSPGRARKRPCGGTTFVYLFTSPPSGRAPARRCRETPSRV
ncbi:MAG: hypothetical protein JO290_06685 [Sphingomonadaceae bacterium]|nr:hypothetical protein [Sphingomonadaceae bacterium]